MVRTDYGTRMTVESYQQRTHIAPLSLLAQLFDKAQMTTMHTIEKTDACHTSMSVLHVSFHNRHKDTHIFLEITIMLTNFVVK